MLRLFVTVLLVSAAVATDFTKCDSGTPPKALAVSGCAKQPCDFKPGARLDVNVTFGVDHKVTKLTPDVKALVLGITTDYPLPQKDGCRALVGASCPLEDGESVTYSLQMNIPPIQIKSDVKLTFTIADDSSKIVTCFKLTGQVA
ncbi:NPC intracellular cholesterol transporter 2 [Bacillus rossius redtenbacheri]|uniref:NPC intracellular cholesterol transporter 2 n=1 Tax=Bacillus rossius redtenbacheri TaxID=93214 RepID=UPI002FDDD382